MCLSVLSMHSSNRAAQWDLPCRSCKVAAVPQTLLLARNGKRVSPKGSEPSISVIALNPLRIYCYKQSALPVALKLLKELHPKNFAIDIHNMLEAPLKVSVVVVHQVLM